MERPSAAPGMSAMRMFCVVFLPFALGHYLSCLLRTVNAVLAPNLVASMALSTAELGLLTSAFFAAFALVQLPVGMALDRYGPRKVQLPLLLLAAGGALLFARGHSYLQLVLARFVIGLGVGGCFMSAVKAISSSIAPARLPSVHGYLIAVGGLGAASATLPVQLALRYTDWRGVLSALALLAALIGATIWLVSPPAVAPTKRAPQSLGALLDVYRHRGFRDTIALMLIPHTIFFGMQGLWIGRWLSDVAHFDDGAVGYLLYLSMAAIIFGAIGVGMLTEWAGKRGVTPLDVAAVGVALFMLIQLGFVCNLKPSFQLLSVLFTLVGTITGLEYAIVAQAMPPGLTGRAATCLNLLIFLGAFVVQAGFGQIIALWAPGEGGHYPPIAYQVGFLVLVLLQLPGLILFLRRRRAVKCQLRIVTSKEEYETGPLRSPRQRKTGSAR